MPRITPYPHSEASGDRKELMDAVKQQFGGVINMFGTVAHSPAALESMLGSFGALGKGRLGPALGEQIAVAVANANGCEYCLSAHTVLGKKAGVSAEAMEEARQGRSADPRSQAAIAFALKVVETRAHIETHDLEELRAAGFDDEEMVEIVAHVALNLFTNYVNVAFDVDVDFPSVKPRQAAA
ncbi:carboxymuconolactone decarboxylase family protein [Pelagibius sp.]|uniref:carboxymuconolactone decarboxylase family protein n=1 Tax=Pelagibius sp. TaxID=1931238 RepID=UPI003B5031C7